MKKKIPLEVHEFLEPYLNKRGDNFHSIPPEKHLMKFIDSDEDSDFYFNIELYKIDNGSLKLLIDFAPENKLSIKNKKIWIKSTDLKKFFSEWLGLLERYDTVKTVFDDPITQAYADEFFDEFELIDDEAENPLSIKQALIIDEHLDELDSGIQKYVNSGNKKEISLLQEGIIDLKENLTNHSKKKVIKSLTRLWARIARLGIPLVKEFLNEAKKQIIKESVRYLMDKATGQ